MTERERERLRLSLTEAEIDWIMEHQIKRRFPERWRDGRRRTDHVEKARQPCGTGY